MTRQNEIISNFQSIYIKHISTIIVKLKRIFILILWRIIVPFLIYLTSSFNRLSTDIKANILWKHRNITRNYIHIYSDGDYIGGDNLYLSILLET